MDIDTAGGNDVPKIAPVYFVRNGEVMLDASVRHAWPYVVNYPSWQNYSIVQHVSGEPGEEGEVVLLKKEEGISAFPPYYARTIKLEPEKRIIWKTYPEKKNQGRDYFGFVEFRVYDAQGRTRFCYNTLYEFLLSYRDEGELDAFRRQQNENAESVYSTVFLKLKELVEKGA